MLRSVELCGKECIRLVKYWFGFSLYSLARVYIVYIDWEYHRLASTNTVHP